MLFGFWYHPFFLILLCFWEFHPLSVFFFYRETVCPWVQTLHRCTVDLSTTMFRGCCGLPLVATKKHGLEPLISKGYLIYQYTIFVMYVILKKSYKNLDFSSRKIFGSGVMAGLFTISTGVEDSLITGEAIRPV